MGYLIHKKTYKRMCPRGYDDCVCDPGYIKFYYPDWYFELYGNKTLRQAVKDCKIAMKNEFDCYDDEDK